MTEQTRRAAVEKLPSLRRYGHLFPWRVIYYQGQKTGVDAIGTEYFASHEAALDAALAWVEHGALKF